MPENKVASDKCDFKFKFGDLEFSGQRAGAKTQWKSEGPVEKLHVHADKCDFQLSFQRRAERLRMESDKCDFRIRSTVERVLPIRMDSISPGADVRVSSDKCDWKIKAVSALRLSKRPELTASLSSDKCDFKMLIEFGLLGGKTIRINAVSSDKCDFRILDQEEEVE